MTSRVIRQGPDHPRPGELKEIVIHCDQMDCDEHTNDEHIRANGGLKEMGWTVVPQSDRLHHYCPKHSR